MSTSGASANAARQAAVTARLMSTRTTFSAGPCAVLMGSSRWGKVGGEPPGRYRAPGPRLRSVGTFRADYYESFEVEGRGGSVCTWRQDSDPAGFAQERSTVPTSGVTSSA